MIKKYGLMVRLPLFLLVFLAMLTAGPAIAGGSGQTVTEKAKGMVCMNLNHTTIDGKCCVSSKISRSQADSNVGPHLDLEMDDDVD